jgi:Family of unknown function (DUF5681)
MPERDYDPTYDVGFGKPPKHSRFQKGRSGNPKGRPRGRRSLATEFERALHEKVVINENGTRKTVTKFAAAMKQLVNKAASGDLAAVRHLTAMATAWDGDPGPDSPTKQLPAADLKVMRGVLKRLEAKTNGEDDADH